MNKVNHFIFALNLCLLFLELNVLNLAYIAIFSLTFGVLLDLDHKFNKKAPWYHRRTWIQEPLGFIFIGLPLARLLSLIDKSFFILVSIPYLSHILLDYICIFETYPLAPFLKVRKKEGIGIFIPDDLFVKSENSEKWIKRVKSKSINGVSENYFTLFNLVLLVMIFISKLYS